MSRVSYQTYERIKVGYEDFTYVKTGRPCKLDTAKQRLTRFAFGGIVTPQYKNDIVHAMG